MAVAVLQERRSTGALVRQPLCSLPEQPQPERSSAVDRHDLDHGLFRTEAVTAEVVLAALELADGDLLTALVLDDLEHGLGTGDERSTDLDAGLVGEQQDGHFDRGADFGLVAVDGQTITGGSTVLVATILDDGVHVKLLRRSAELGVLDAGATLNDGGARVVSGAAP